MTWCVVTHVVPAASENHLLKKLLFFYWELVNKCDASTGKLKDEMFLVTNSLRLDLLHSNEYIRGRTLRML